MFGSKKPEENMQVHSTEQIEKEIAEASAIPVATSTQTPHELYLLHKLGYEPVRVVFGNVVYSMGAKGFFRSLRGLFIRGEMTDFSRLNTDARQLAHVRVQKEAEKIGCSAVFGIRIDVRELADFLEVICTGTAVKKVSAPDLSETVTVGL